MLDAETLLPWLLTAPAVVALLMSALNARFWPRGTTPAPGTKPPPGTTICIPARNEAESIEACVRAAVATGVDEVLVLDDGSTDATPAILERLRAELPTLRVHRLDAALPEGWVGKPRACTILEKTARGAHLVYVDADVVLAPDAIVRLDALRHRYGADAVTAVPRQITVGFLERLVLPLLHVTYTAWLFLPLIWRTHDPRFLAANGQILWLERDALDVVGGWQAVRGEIVDDMAMCRALKRARRRVLFADGHEVGRCRMYRTPKAVIDGFSKNLFEGVGSLVGLGVVFALYGGAFIAPWLLFSGLLVDAVVRTGSVDVAATSPWLVPAVVAMVAALALRLIHVVRHRSDVVSAMLNPVGVAVLLGIAARSWWWSVRGRIEWSGRQYGARRTRVAHSR
jgi:chlorobactene glucosyltransferase